MMQLLSAWGRQQNPYYDQEKANNGGGYFQPLGEANVYVEGHGIVTIGIDDTSCGDFGDRICIFVACGENRWSAYYDTMDDSGNTEAELHTIREDIERCLGVDARELVRFAYGAICAEIERQGLTVV